MAYFRPVTVNIHLIRSHATVKSDLITLYDKNSDSSTNMVKTAAIKGTTDCSISIHFQPFGLITYTSSPAMIFAISSDVPYSFYKQ